ncbi:MAG: class I SAM-dependent methyltransferase [Thermoleophilaceae bacterium]|nr:class I SAM-dependent methyltransferase [Thermoleophilaceae bacterium]
MPLHRCRSCGFVFAASRTAAQLQELYGDEYFDEFHCGTSYREDAAQHRFESQIRRDWICEYVAHGRLLEIGSAAGFFLDEMRAVSFEVHGVEPAQATAAFAREELGLDVRTGFIEDVELPDGRFDVVAAWHVVEHIFKPQQAMQRLRSVINSDGLLFLEVPNIASVSAKHFKENWFHLDPKHHVGFYDAKTIGLLLESTGFEVVNVDTKSPFDYMLPGQESALSNRLAVVKNALFTRTIPHRTHPWKHELLRVVARPI